MFPCGCFLPVCFFPFRKKERAVLHSGSAGWAGESSSECDGLCVAAVVDIVSGSAMDSMLSQKEAGTLGSRDRPSPEVLPSFL